MTADEKRAWHRAYNAKPSVKERHRLESLAWRKTHRELDRRRKREWKKANRIRALLHTLRSRCRKLGVVCDLTAADIVIPEQCPVLGLRLDSGPRECRASVDRKRPKRGYIRGNIAVISMRANRIKSDASIQELEAILAYMRGD